jgi:uracil-DNA glycosylase
MASSLLVLPAAWEGIFSHGYTRKQFADLAKGIGQAFAEEEVYPLQANVFRALQLVRPADVKVVILGQDPYPTPGSAHGLSFSVMPPTRAPASLVTIFQELERSVPNWKRPTGGNLEPWAKQGVLLLNTLLTVRAREPMSHAGKGWEPFTQAVLRLAQASSPFLVFLLWGAKAQTLAKPLIDLGKHAIIEGSHPSRMAQNRMPPGRRFVGNGHFLEVNRLLVSKGQSAVDWRLPSNEATVKGGDQLPLL